MQKELSNDQRARLEQIARDEFRIKQSEVSAERNKAYQSWCEAEKAKVLKSKLFKDYIKARKTTDRLYDQGIKKGFSMMAKDRIGSNPSTPCVTLHSDGYGGKPMYPGIKAQLEKTKNNPNGYTRALNEVLSVIWSMEKPFKECMALIHKTVKSIK